VPTKFGCLKKFSHDGTEYHPIVDPQGPENSATMALNIII